MKLVQSTVLNAILGTLLTLPTIAQEPTPADTSADTTAVLADRAAPADSAEDPLAKFVKEFKYRNLGPGAMSGRITALAVPEPFHKTIYVGTASGGVWKTSNGGTTWSAITDKIGTQSIGDIAVAPSSDSILWVGTGEKNSLRSNSWGNGVHKSTDGGKTWEVVGLENSKLIGRIVIHPSNPDVVYVAALGHLWGPHSERGIYKTTDGGETWEQMLFVDDTTGFVDLQMDPSNPDVLFAAAWHRLRWGGGHMQGVGAGGGIYKTTDGGQSWTRLNDPALNNGLPAGELLGRIGIAIYPRNPRIVYAVIQSNEGVRSSALSPFGGVYRSDDGGDTWRQMNDLSAVPFYYYNEIWVDPNDSSHVFINAAPLWESKDGGETFSRKELQRVHGDHHAMWIDPEDSDHIVLGTDGGVYMTWDEGKTWDHQTIPVGQFYTVMVDSTHTPYHVCGGLQDNGSWCGPSAVRDGVGITDNAWYRVFGGDGFWVQVPWHDPHTVYAESQFANMSRINLKTWERTSIRPLAADAGAQSGYGFHWGWNTPMVLSQHDSTVLYLGSNHVIRLTDRGDNWEILGPDMTRAARSAPEPEIGHTSYQALFSIAESPRSPDIIWAGSDDGLVWLTRDGGKNWSNVTGNFPSTAPTRCFVNNIAASHHDDGTAYLAYDCHRRDDYEPHLYRTMDFGSTWIEIVAGLPEDGASLSVLEDARNQNLIWVGTEVGVFVSFDGGDSWLPFNNGLPPVGVRMMAQAYKARDLVIGTFGRGIWVNHIGPLQEMNDTLLDQKAHLFEITSAYLTRSVNTYGAIGSKDFIASNPPQGAVLRYYLKDSADKDVKLIVTNQAGDTVRTLTNRGYPGLHSVTWDLKRQQPRPRRLGESNDNAELRRVKPGVYTVELKVHGLTLTREFEVQEWPEDRLGRIR